MNRDSNHRRPSAPSGLWGSPEFLFAITRGAYREGPAPGDGSAPIQSSQPAATPIRAVPRRQRIALYLAAAQRRLAALWSGDKSGVTKTVPAE